MTEKEKMLKGLMYNANNNEEINKDRAKARTLCYEFNKLHPNKLETEGVNIIKELFNKTGKKFWIEAPIRCDYGYNIEIGENFYCNYNCTILDVNKVVFGNNVFIGPNCSFYTALHPLDAGERNEGLEYAKPITIGDNVWFGGSVTVLPGVTIGSNSVIGAGSVVTKDIPEGVVAVGNPCKVIREI